MFRNGMMEPHPFGDKDEEPPGKGRSMSTHQHSPSYHQGPSPTLAHFSTSFTPARTSYERSSYSTLHHPSTPASLPLPSAGSSAHLRHPHSPPLKGLPSLNGSSYGAREKPSNYYDPTSDQAGPSSSWNHSLYSRQSPVRTQPQHAHQQTRDLFLMHGSPAEYNLDGRRVTPGTGHGRHHSPQYAPPQSHPSSRIGSVSQSPAKPSVTSPVVHHDYTRHSSEATISAIESPLSPKVEDSPRRFVGEAEHSQRPTRTTNPMSVSSILSDTYPEPTVPPRLDQLQATTSDAQRVVGPSTTRRASHGGPKTHMSNTSSDARRPSAQPPRLGHEPVAKTRSRREPVATEQTRLAKNTPTTSDKENDARPAEPLLEEEGLSDIDIDEFRAERERFVQKSRKRVADIEALEDGRRKRRRAALRDKLTIKLLRINQVGEARFHNKYSPAAIAEVHQKEIVAEKERKKDMQRKRRREKAVQNEEQKRIQAMEKAKSAADAAERERFVKEAQRAERKAKATKLILQNGDERKELSEVTPLAPNLEGGTMNSFSMAVEPELEGPTPKKQKRSGKGGSRPRKSKEQKQAEKDAAEAAHAAMERNEPVMIAPKEPKEDGKDSKDTRKKDAKEVKEVKEPKEASPAPPAPFVSKGYNQLYDQIWKDIARKDEPKAHRIKDTSLHIKQSNLRKTAQLSSKEARRWQQKTNKTTKDVQGRAKRGLREMMSFWKQNEKEENNNLRLAKKKAQEDAKRAEAEWEERRSRRRLTFLLTQTTFISKQVGSKIKTDEIERSGQDAEAAVSNGADQSSASEQQSIGKVTDLNDVDFDNADEAELDAIARANGQSTMEEVRNRARAFNDDGEEGASKDINFDDGELNLQNPSSLQDTSVAQPNILTCQLKEYQLKGLNWLVNLYDLGINGILADEMGLGKTVQSISVMAYLAEKHNIWGPFLVIAPSSTLHNWQQELTKFVPQFKVMPYWGSANDRKKLRKHWDRSSATYSKDAPFHVFVTSYQLVVLDARYFQKIKWQYMILDEAQAIKSSDSSRWKCLLGFHCRNRLLLTGTPIQNNMKELWALLHFIMPSLFDSHDAFNDWFSKDIESHAESNTTLDREQLSRLHQILKPFMLRRIKKHVQKELGDKIEEDVFCDLTYRQRAYYVTLRDRISVMDLIEKAAFGNEQDATTLMNLVMQFRKVCNHPDLFERAETRSPLSMAHFAETASFMREGSMIGVGYSTRNMIEYHVPRLIYCQDGRLDIPGPTNGSAGTRGKYLNHLMNIWTPGYIEESAERDGAFAWLPFVQTSAGEVASAVRVDLFSRAVGLSRSNNRLGRLNVVYDDEHSWFSPASSLLRIVDRNDRGAVAAATVDGYMADLLNVSRRDFEDSGLRTLEPCSRPGASAPPVEIVCLGQAAEREKQDVLFNVSMRKSLFPLSEADERKMVEAYDPAFFPPNNLLPAPISQRAGFSKIFPPSMSRFVSDSGKLAKLDQLLQQLKDGGHRVLLYFQMTRMIDLVEEYLTYRKYRYLRLDGSTKLEDRRDRVHEFQTRPEVFVFLLSTRAGGLGINLTAADTVIFYDSDWNPTIDSQAMDRAHRLGQTRQVTVYRMITRGTIEERIRKRALQKEEVQRVVISGDAAKGVDFNVKAKESRAKDIAILLADDDQVAEIERKEAEILAAEAKAPQSKKKKAASSKKKVDVSLEEMYHEGEGHFDDVSNKPSGTATPVDVQDTSASGKKGAAAGGGSKKGNSKRARTAKERLRMADGGD